MSIVEVKVDTEDDESVHPAPIIKAAQHWRTNGELIADVARLGYIRTTDKVLDPTHGKGKWWTEFRPHQLVTHDLAIDQVDFRSLPHDDGEFDVVAFDPPYVSAGGRKTTTIDDFYERYGLRDAPTSPASLQVMNNDGLTEAKRVVKKRGFILVKTMNYVSSGKLWLGTYHTQFHALEELDLIEVDSFVHIGHAGPQPKHNKQVHARTNVSFLYVFQKRGGK